MLLSTFVFYTVGYGIRFWGWGNSDLAVLLWIITHAGLLGTSYFPYIVGMLFCKKRVIAFLRQRLAAIRFRNIYIYIFTALTFTGMIVVHGLIPSLFVAFITATVTIILFCICPLPAWLTDTLCYFGEYSTSIWLVHMFFYSVLFKNLIFNARYPIPIFLLLIALSLASSYVIKWLSRPILKLVR